MYENSKIIKLCIEKLKEKYGDDFKLETDDEFVFTLNDSVLILRQEEKTMKIKYMLDTAIHLDVNLFTGGCDWNHECHYCGYGERGEK